jgi:hypothetical protein
MFATKYSEKDNHCGRRANLPFVLLKCTTKVIDGMKISSTAEMENRPKITLCLQLQYPRYKNAHANVSFFSPRKN